MSVVILMLLSISVISYSSSFTQVSEPSSVCIKYDPAENIITITCKLTDSNDNQLRDANILHKESYDHRVI